MTTILGIVACLAMLWALSIAEGQKAVRARRAVWAVVDFLFSFGVWLFVFVFQGWELSKAAWHGMRRK